MRQSINSIGLLFWVTAVFLWSCVSPAPIEGAPCPCPHGFQCCDVGNICISDDKTCPVVLPASSAAACESDAQCPLYEFCHRWQFAGQQYGSGECRHACLIGQQCASEEVCTIAPTNGDELDITTTRRMCLPDTPHVGCEDTTCRLCANEPSFSLFCGQHENADRVQTCAYVMNPVCGVDCKIETVEHCIQGGLCELSDGVATCGDRQVFKGAICTEFDCDYCEATPGGSTCDENAVTRCATTPYNGEGCNRICFEKTESCRPEQRCVEQSHTAFCTDNFSAQ